MGLWQILKGEQPGLLKSVLHYRNAGQFGEYLIDYALQNEGRESPRFQPWDDRLTIMVFFVFANIIIM